MKTLEGMYDGKGLKIAIVASRFNEFITTKLVGGAEDCLFAARHRRRRHHTGMVTGAFEIALSPRSWHSPASMMRSSASVQ